MREHRNLDKEMDKTSEKLGKAADTLKTAGDHLKDQNNSMLMGINSMKQVVVSLTNQIQSLILDQRTQTGLSIHGVPQHGGNFVEADDFPSMRINDDHLVRNHTPGDLGGALVNA